MRKFRWVLVWSILTVLVVAEDYKTIQRQSSRDVQTYKKVALVIGNNRYDVSPLSNAVNDAVAVKNFLKSAGFQVVYASNANEYTMQSKVTEFLGKLDSKSVGFVYYSGHGIQEYSQKERRTVNFLIPTNNRQFKSLTDLDYHAISLNYILDSLSEKKNGLNIVLLDACRTPFKAFSRSSQIGLAPSNATGVYIAYATASGDKALDNGQFRRSFIQHANESLKLVDIFEKVKEDVYSTTRQIPFTSNGKIGSFYFRKKVKKSVVIPVTPVPVPIPAPVVVKPYHHQAETVDTTNYLDEKSSCEKVQLMYISVSHRSHISSYRSNPLFTKNNLNRFITECDNGQSAYCNRLGVEYDRGKILSRDYKKSVKFYMKGCSFGNEWSCISLANAYKSGQGIMKNKNKAIELYQKLCKNNNVHACNNLGNLLYGDKKVLIYRKACDLGDRFSCLNLAYYYKYGQNGVKKNCSKVLSLYTKSCELGNKKACKELKKTKSSNW